MRQARFEPLEQRTLLAAIFPTAEEQYMIELMNRARANPTAEAQRYNINLTEGVMPGEITPTPKQPLAINLFLNYAARAQADWNRRNTTLQTFSHSGPGGNSPTDRMIAAGYSLAPDDLDLENAAINLYGALGSGTTLVEQQYQAYFVDTGNADGGRGHRIHILADLEKEAGSGIATGPYQYTNPNTHVTSTYQAFTTIIDFAEHDSVPYLTGVAYTDNVKADSFYEPGEGIGDVNIAAVRVSDGKTFVTKTWAAGGYTLGLEAGTYNVYGFGDALGGFASYGNVTVTTLNVKKDFTPAMVSFASAPLAVLANGVLFVNGTGGADVVSVNSANGTTKVTRSGDNPAAEKNFLTSQISRIEVDLGAGNDKFTAPGTAAPIYVLGGIGDDSINGGNGNDTLTGAGGKDHVVGNAGDDRLNGGSSNDIIEGNAGGDRLYGGEGNDKLFGYEGIDRLFGEAGNDYLVGGSSNDKLYGGAGDDSMLGQGQNDLLDGEAGNDTAMGGDGNDQVAGGVGLDHLFGNDGNDIFDSFDSLVDTVDGGLGTNTGKMDAGDKKIAMS